MGWLRRKQGAKQSELRERELFLRLGEVPAAEWKQVEFYSPDPETVLMVSLAGMWVFQAEDQGHRRAPEAGFSGQLHGEVRGEASREVNEEGGPEGSEESAAKEKTGLAAGWRLSFRCPWQEVSLARWDSEDEVLTFTFWSSGAGTRAEKTLAWSGKVDPTSSFMEIVREGIAATQVYSTKLHLPSGLEKTVQVLRDQDRNLYLEPSVEWFKNPDDRRYLRETVRGWEQKLGIKVG